jgi:hypothetical protein
MCISCVLSSRYTIHSFFFFQSQKNIEIGLDLLRSYYAIVHLLRNNFSVAYFIIRQTIIAIYIYIYILFRQSLQVVRSEVYPSSWYLRNGTWKTIGNKWNYRLLPRHMPHEYSLLFQLLLNLDRIRKAYSDEYEFFVRPFNHKQGNKRIEE